MRSNEELFPWLQPSWGQLTAYHAQQRIPQALLISGPKGVGKYELARHFSKSILCVQPTSEFKACGQCQSCQLFSANTHPDFSVIAPEESGKNITINQIRNLISFLSLTSQFDNYRLVIINDAHQITNAAANSFLKSLEEPVEKTSIVLISDNPALLPATIRSRCQKLFIKRPGSEIAKQWLKQHQISGDLDILLDLSQGAPLAAYQYANDLMLETRKACLADWLKISQQQANPVGIAEQWQQFPDSLLIFWMTTWAIDTIKCCIYQNTGKCYNSDLKLPLQELAQRLELKKLFKFYDLLLIAKNRLSTQLNRQLIFEEILINWSQLSRK